MTNRIVHFEIVADDLDRVRSFYEDVFGWTFETWKDPEGEVRYHLITTGKEGAGIDGGMMVADEFEQRVVNVIDVEDIDAALESVEDNGGTIVVDRQAVPGVGWTAYFTDPDGHVFGMMEEDESAG